MQGSPGKYCGHFPEAEQLAGIQYGRFAVAQGFQLPYFLVFTGSPQGQKTDIRITGGKPVHKGRVMGKGPAAGGAAVCWVYGN